jgi:hypothetical protein
MSPEDDQLVRFLRQHRPSPSSPRVTLEEDLLNIIDREAKISRPARRTRSRILATLLAAIALILFGHSRWLTTTPKVSTTSDEELEAFLWDNWQETLGEPSNHLPVAPPESRRLTYSTYHP